MNEAAARRLSRLLALDTLGRNITALAFCALVLIVFVSWIASNVVASSQILEGRFVRWTVAQHYLGQGAPFIFVDLPDGRTVGARVLRNWRQPSVGDVVHLEELTNFWSGRQLSPRPVPTDKMNSGGTA